MPPNPARFREYIETPDMRGFTIPGCDHVFEFDDYDGWFDEYGNYYNKYGEPTNPPGDEVEDVLIEDRPEEDFEVDDEDQGNQDGNYDEVDDFEDDENDIDGESGATDYSYEEDFTEEETQAEKKRLEDQLKRINDYKEGMPIDVDIDNIRLNTLTDDFMDFLEEKEAIWRKITPNLDDDGIFDGTFTISVNKKNIEKLIQLNGQRYKGRILKVVILKPCKSEPKKSFKVEKSELTKEEQEYQDKKIGLSKNAIEMYGDRPIEVVLYEFENADEEMFMDFLESKNIQWRSVEIEGDDLVVLTRKVDAEKILGLNGLIFCGKKLDIEIPDPSDPDSDFEEEVIERTNEETKIDENKVKEVKKEEVEKIEETKLDPAPEVKQIGKEDSNSVKPKTIKSLSAFDKPKK